MPHFDYLDWPYPIRQGLVDAYRDYWAALARPGNWFRGAERIAIAAEVRNAVVCPFCAERKTALSPYSVTGRHQQGTSLDDRVVDAVHRVITDQSRITAAYITDNAAAGLSEEQYVELVGIAVVVLSIDEFNRALGLPVEPLPQPIAGEPDHYRPSQAVTGTGFLPMIPSAGATGKEADLWPKGEGANVLRALSLVPDAVRAWLAISDQQYLSAEKMSQLTGDTGLAIDRMQIELVAGRVSSVNECFY